MLSLPASVIGRQPVPLGCSRRRSFSRPRTASSVSDLLVAGLASSLPLPVQPLRRWSEKPIITWRTYTRRSPFPPTAPAKFCPTSQGIRLSLLMSLRLGGRGRKLRHGVRVFKVRVNHSRIGSKPPGPLLMPSGLAGLDPGELTKSDLASHPDRARHRRRIVFLAG